MPTPHISAKMGDVAEAVLMPGDPLRAKFIAENFLENPVLYNEVRGMLGYTGTYKGKRVSVQGSGMGQPSIGIYAHELYSQYGVRRIIRVGTAGAFQPDMKIGDLIIALGACTNSAFASQFNLPGAYAPIASFGMLEKAVETARGKGVRFYAGNILSSDTFYCADEAAAGRWRDMGILAVEMEAAALYMTAAWLKKEALTVLTISDHVFTGEAADSVTRQTAFTDMMEIALETAVSAAHI
ncbi:MAG: purine-nucleoside phosphorylase [Defluviitaleaceae bacterium]|nr:purine-nucleoside phosphorylase [Defluviitaleaceae bacterium]MCL2836774.1 purine-nucleoside phosphorylase [Defluviitaleaceae bacterium]